jgi:hypothetical protein
MWSADTDLRSLFRGSGTRLTGGKAVLLLAGTMAFVIPEGERAPLQPFGLLIARLIIVWRE